MTKHVSRALLLFAVVLSHACADCGTAKSSAKVTRSAAPRTAPQFPPIVKLPDGKPMSPEVFRPYEPDTLAGFKATGPAKAISSTLANGGTLTTLSRTYKREELTLRLELSDVLHAPLLPRLVKGQQGLDRKAANSTFQGTSVAGFPSVLQYQTDARTSYANVLIGEHIMLNARVSPAEDVQTSVEVAAALPLAEIAKLEQRPAEQQVADKADKPGVPATATAHKPGKAAPPPHANAKVPANEPAAATGAEGLVKKLRTASAPPPTSPPATTTQR